MGIEWTGKPLLARFGQAAILLWVSGAICPFEWVCGQEYPPLPTFQSSSSLRDSEVRPAAWSSPSRSDPHPEVGRGEPSVRSSPVEWTSGSSSIRAAQPVSGHTRVQEPSSGHTTSPLAGEDSLAGRTSTPLNPRSNTAETSQPARRSTFQVLVSLGSSLVFVLGIFFGLAWLYKKSMLASGGSSLPSTVVQVLGKTTLAPRQQLVLLRFGSKLVLVSNIQGETRTVSEIVDPLEVDQLTGLCESNRPGSMSHSFREILSQGARS